MMDVTAPQLPTPIGRIKTVALGEPMIEPAGRGMIDWSDRLKRGSKGGGWGAAMGAVAGIVHSTADALRGHTGVVVGQVKEQPRQTNGHAIGGIQAEEPHPRL